MHFTMRFSGRLLALSALMLSALGGGLAACAQAPVAPAASVPPPGGAATPAQPALPPPQSALNARLMYELLLGEFSFEQGNPRRGAAFMLDAARRTGDAALYRRATDMALQSRHGPAALDAASAWRRAHPDSVEANRYELQVLMLLGRVTATEAPLRATLAAVPLPERAALITAIPALYARAADRDQALRVVERALADALADPATTGAAWTTVGRMRLHADDKAGALAAAEAGRAADPYSEWPAVLALQLMAGAGVAQAEPLVREYLQSPYAKPEVGIGYAQALAEADRADESNAQLNALIQRYPDSPESWLALGLAQAQAQEDGQARQSLQRFLSLVPEEGEGAQGSRRTARTQAFMVLAQMAERQRDYAEAEQWLARIDTEEDALAVQARRAALLARQHRLDEARRLIQMTPEIQPDDARLKLLAEAQLLRDHGQPRAAFAMLRAELARQPGDEDLIYDAAMAAEKAENLAEMERLLRRLIRLRPDSAHAYNALGYSLANRGLRLAEARRLIDKAVALAPDDAYIQDSLGWIAFRQGRLAEARRILTAAYKRRPDAEIAAHLGEVLWTLGERDEANALWQKGLRLNPDNETLLETMQRLRGAP